MYDETINLLRIQICFHEEFRFHYSVWLSEPERKCTLVKKNSISKPFRSEYRGFKTPSFGEFSYYKNSNDSLIFFFLLNVDAITDLNAVNQQTARKHMLRGSQSPLDFERSNGINSFKIIIGYFLLINKKKKIIINRLTFLLISAYHTHETYLSI